LSPPPRQLLVYRFREEASFEGQLVGALQRIEVGAAVRVLDGLFVGREPDSGELIAASLGAATSSSLVASLVGFRLDRAERMRTTERVLAGPDGERIRELGARLAPGEVVFTILLEHAWAAALADAVERVGGEVVGRSEFVEAENMSELLPRIADEVSADS
jgi:hypothetical protein